MPKKVEAKPKVYFAEGTILSITNEETGDTIEFLGGATVIDKPFIWKGDAITHYEIDVERPHGIAHQHTEGKLKTLNVFSETELSIDAEL